MRATFETPYPTTRPDAADAPRLFRVTNEPHTSFTALRILSDREWEIYQHATRDIGDFGRGDDLLIASENNYSEFAVTYLELQSHKVDDAQSRNLGPLLALEINRKLTNYLSSFRLYLDFCESRLKRRYGKDSIEVREFKEACSTAFDTSFPYRFVTKLRNFSQHFGMPIGHIRGRGSIIRSDDPEYSNEICFDTEELLRIGGDLWGPVRADLNTAPAQIEVGPVMAMAPSHLRGIREVLIGVESPHLRRASIDMLKVLADALDGDGRPTVGIWENHSGRLGIRLFNPPFPTLTSIGLDQLPKPRPGRRYF
jgi:hypothetical protein